MLPLFLRPGTNGEMSFPLTGGAFVLVGAIMALACYLSLNRSFGLIPGLRRVKTGGVYMLVRHPMYASYVVLHFGYVLASVSLLNITLVVTTVVCNMIRAVREEAVLVQDEEYQLYTERVRWRFLPGVF